MSKKFLGIARLFILSMLLFLPVVAYAEIFFQDDFESGNLSIWEIFEQPGDPCDSTGQITATTEDRFSGTYSAKFNIPVGDMCTLMQYYPWPTPVGQGRDIYWRFRLKYAANYDWRNSGNKVTEIRGDRITRDNGARIIFYTNRVQEAWSIPIPADSHQAIPFIEISANDNVKGGRVDETWHPPNDPNGTWFSQNINTANPIYIVAGQWYTIEIYVKVNTDNNNDGVINANDVADGGITLWVNGTKVIELNNLYTISAPSQSYYITELGGTINQPEYVVSQNTSFYFDDVIVSDTCNSCNGNGGDTPPPSDNDSSGGDASGGSGCGFAKDGSPRSSNNIVHNINSIDITLFILFLFLIFLRTRKNNSWHAAAKSKDLLFAMMLIVILKAIVLSRRLSSKLRYNL